MGYQCERMSNASKSSTYGWEGHENKTFHISTGRLESHASMEKGEDIAVRGLANIVAPGSEMSFKRITFTRGL